MTCFWCFSAAGCYLHLLATVDERTPAPLRAAETPTDNGIGTKHVFHMLVSISGAAGFLPIPFAA